MNVAISDEMVAAMKSDAQGSGDGTFITLDNKGEFVSGVVASIVEREAPFGTVQELMLTNVRTHDGARDPAKEFSFGLSRTVLQREFGSEAEDGGAKVGMLIFCEAQGESMTKAGKPYFRYSCAKKSVADATALAKAAPPVKVSAADAKAALEATFGAEEVTDADIPF